LHINKAKKTVFRMSSTEELVDAIAEFGGCILLSVARLKEEVLKLSSSEVENTKKKLQTAKRELSKMKESLNAAQKSNDDLAGKLRMALEEHSHFETIKQFQRSRLDDLIANNERLIGESELLKSDLSVTKASLEAE